MYATSPHHPLSRIDTEEEKPKSGPTAMRATKVLSKEVQTAIRSSLVYTLFLHDHHAQILAVLVKTRTPLCGEEIEYLEKAYKRTQSH